jgi:hypothetical protein
VSLPAKDYVAALLGAGVKLRASARAIVRLKVGTRTKAKTRAAEIGVFR